MTDERRSPSIEDITETLAEHSDFTDKPIECIECRCEFIWSAGEQEFDADKGLDNPPKRCKQCKKAKTHRIDAIISARAVGKKFIVAIPVLCDSCGKQTTVPFYPSQGRPVYCRKCFETKSSTAAGAGSPQ
jgi:CxxC-x17-CxxC domain-containing protein